MVDRLLSTIADTPWLNAAMIDFDFEIERCANGPAEPVHLADGRALTMFAGDASGGAFLFAGEGGEERPVVYAGSEGTGGLIAIGGARGSCDGRTPAKSARRPGSVAR